MPALTALVLANRLIGSINGFRSGTFLKKGEGEDTSPIVWEECVSLNCPVAVFFINGADWGVDVQVHLLGGDLIIGVVRIYLDDLPKSERTPYVRSLEEALALPLIHWTFLPAGGWE